MYREQIETEINLLNEVIAELELRLHRLNQQIPNVHQQNPDYYQINADISLLQTTLASLRCGWQALNNMLPNAPCESFQSQPVYAKDQAKAEYHAVNQNYP